MRYNYFLAIFFTLLIQPALFAQQILSEGEPARLDIRKAGENSIRITLKPASFKDDFPYTPAAAEKKYPSPIISLRTITGTIKKQVGNLEVEVSSKPLTVVVRNAKNELVQRLILRDEGRFSFSLTNAPVLGLGEGGPKPVKDKDWREQKVQFDRRKSYDSMQPRWQSDAYGSRNPVPMIIGTEGWAIFVASPWVAVDMLRDSIGYFIPWKPARQEVVPQNVKNQSLNAGKGLPPMDKLVAGLYDFFVFDAHDPLALMKNFSLVTGPAVMPPKWALGYMQSHRRLETDKQMIALVDTFRSKKIPLDAVIYLGTGFTPRGWNKLQPSFEFNPEVFTQDPKDFISKIHALNSKIVLHMVPWDRDRLPTLHGSIPAKPGETLDAAHIQNYWKEHEGLVNSGVDAFWPDEGDWFNLYERIKRHQLYYEGHLSTHPNVRPWSLQRNGFPGIAQWGGWVWSGDTESSWKTLEAQIAVGLNYSLTIGPFWGTDIGGFFPNEELTGELYARWFQFGAFNASFRSHGVTWRTRLPWGWGLPGMEPKEGRRNPLQSEMNNKAIEPIAKKYDELRYQLMPYTYTLAWEARNTGLPLMRALWLHYPKDTIAAKTGDEFLWGRDLLIAPVYQKGASNKTVYLPQGDWFDWWSNKKFLGGQTISQSIDLATMPIYVRAGAIIPIDPVRQYTGEKVQEPTTLKIYTGNTGSYSLYEDDGISQEYLKNKFSLTKIDWDDKAKKLSIQPQSAGGNATQKTKRLFKVELIPQGIVKEVNYSGKPIEILF